MRSGRARRSRLFKRTGVSGVRGENDRGHNGRPTDEPWSITRDRLLLEAMENHDQSTGTCLDCYLPIRLHPPERTIRSDPMLCMAAKARAEDGDDG